ncbi:MAG TPA: hypothetical protein VF934_11145 [Burkholderiales bacterium]
MKAAILFTAAFVLAAAAHAGDGDSDIVGKWTWTRADNACTEIYEYRPDGTLLVQSGAEKTDNTYSIAALPDQNGFFKLDLKIVKDHGGKDCADSEEDSTGQEQTVYILFHSSRTLHAVCREPSLEVCYGPLRRVKE